jgi:hypothetical protein
LFYPQTPGIIDREEREALIFCWLLLIGVNRADLHETRNVQSY